MSLAINLRTFRNMFLGEVGQVLNKTKSEARITSHNGDGGGKIEALLSLLGEHFIGLWIYKPFTGQGKRYWFVTFRDANLQLWETDRANSPAEALQQALDCLKRQNLGEAVNPEQIGIIDP